MKYDYIKRLYFIFFNMLFFIYYVYVIGGVIKIWKFDWEMKLFWIIIIWVLDDFKYNVIVEFNVIVLDFNDNMLFFFNELYLFSVME